MKNLEKSSQNYHCLCDGWEKSFIQIISAQIFASIHGMNKYDGEPFKYCPWCGEKLEKENS